MPRGARPQSPRRHRGRARLDGRSGRRCRRDRHLPGEPPEARGVGPGRAHARDQPQGRRDRAPRRRRGPVRRRLDRPDRPPPRLRRPDPRDDPLPRARRHLRGAGARPGRGRRGPHHHRDGAGHPRGQGRDLRRARGVQGHRPRGADPVLGQPAAQRRQDAARHRHRRRPHDARVAEGRRHRPELLDRPRGHARRDPLPRRVLQRPGALHPERRAAAPGPGRRDDLPGEARAARRGARRVHRALRHLDRRRLLRHDPGAHPRDRRALRRPDAARRLPAARSAPAAPQLDDDRDRARAGSRTDARRRARQLAGLAQGEGAAAHRRLRRPRADRRGPGRGRRARAGPLRCADRAHRRGRADARGGQARLALAADTTADRLDRAGRHQARARADARAARS